MDSDGVKSIIETLAKLNPTVLGMFLATLLGVTMWLSGLFASYMHNREISRLIEAVNNNTNSVNLLLELSKVLLGSKKSLLKIDCCDIGGDGDNGKICEKSFTEPESTQDKNS